MSVLITNCFQWIGFHLTNHFLEQGYEVDGVHFSMSDKEEYLSMFLGRNSLFTLNNDFKNKQFDIAIHLGESQAFKTVRAKKTFTINPVNRNSFDPSVIAVYVPLLIGEWMPMNETGMYNQQGEFISFDSDHFSKEGIYIDLFIKAFIQLINSTHLPKNIYMYANHKDILQKNDFFKEIEDGKQPLFNNKVEIFIPAKKEEVMRLENSIFIRDNVPIDRKLTSLINHYKKNQQYYLA